MNTQIQESGFLELAHLWEERMEKPTKIFKSLTRTASLLPPTRGGILPLLPLEPLLSATSSEWASRSRLWFPSRARLPWQLSLFSVWRTPCSLEGYWEGSGWVGAEQEQEGTAGRALLLLQWDGPCTSLGHFSHCTFLCTSQRWNTFIWPLWDRWLYDFRQVDQTLQTSIYLSSKWLS